VRLVSHKGESGTERVLTGPTAHISFGKAQYQWHAKAGEGYADPDGPAAEATITAGAETVFDVPAASLTVIRGTLRD